MMLKETAAVPADALPLAELKAELRLGYGFADDNAQDTLLTRLLHEAVATVEQRLSLALIRRGFELAVTAWNRNGHLILPTGPVAAIDTFELIGGSTRTLDAADWQLSTERTRQTLSGPGGSPLPPLAGDLRARLVFEAGIGSDWSGVPADLSRAVLILAAHAYDARGREAGTPSGVMALLDLHRPVRL